MSLFGGGNDRPTPAPAPPPLPAPLPTPPSYASSGNRGGGGPSGSNNRVPGFGSTLLTSPMGADESSTNTSRKSLLGQ